MTQSPTWESKCWGRVWHRFYDDLLGESLLEVEDGWCCSIHWHQSRWNCFIAIDATLLIETFGPASQTPQPNDKKILSAGQSLVVAPGIWHRFCVLKAGRVAELYWTTDGSHCQINDIVRWNEGGRSAAAPFNDQS